MSGWILKHRKILSHWLYPTQQGRAFTSYEAWDDLLFKASFEAKKEYYNGSLFDIAVGECIVSTNKLAEHWKWTRRKTEKFLKLLESEQMISRSKFDEKNFKSSTRLIVTNYEDLQLKTLTKSTTDSTSNDTTDSTLLNNIKNINKLSSVKKNKPPYEEIKDLYNSICSDLAKITTIGDKREKLIDKAWKMFPDIEQWKIIFAHANTIKWNLEPPNDKPNFNQIFEKSRYIECLEQAAIKNESQTKYKKYSHLTVQNEEYSLEKAAQGVL